MTQYGLNTPKIRAAFEQMGREAVPDGVRGQLTRHPRARSVPSGKMPDAIARNRSHSCRYKQMRAAPPGKQCRTPGRLVLPNRFNHMLSYCNDPLLPAIAIY